MMECSCEILVGGSPKSTHKNTPDRLDKSRSALAEAGPINKFKLLCRVLYGAVKLETYWRIGPGQGRVGQERGGRVLAAAWLGFK